MAKIRFLTGDT